jgi:hypothetical protein
MGCAQYRTALHFAGPNGGFIDGGSGGAEARNAVGDSREGNDRDGGVDHAADLFGVGVGWALNVHSYHEAHS